MKRIIAIVGMPGSGKSVFAQRLKTSGLPVVRFGAIITAEIERRGLPVTPDHERLVREELRSKHGMAAIAQLGLSAIQSCLGKSETVVIDGLYSFSEYRLLTAEFGDILFLVAIVARRAVRYRRLASRVVRPLSPSEAYQRDLQEIETLEKGGPIAIADVTILNDGPVEQLLSEAEKLANHLCGVAN